MRLESFPKAQACESFISVSGFAAESLCPLPHIGNSSSVTYGVFPFSSLLLLAALTGSPSGVLDPAFERIPFNQWLAEPAVPHFHWTVNVPRAVLSFHQRFLSRILAEVDGKDLETRRDDGELVCFFQITDAQGTRFQSHAVVDLSKLDAKIRAATVQMGQRAFLLPGDYQLAAALLDTRTGEHSTAQSKFRVAAPSSGLLLRAWRGLPAVEFVSENQSPESWYLPEIQGHMQWAAGMQTATPLNVVLNLSPSLPGLRARATPSDGLPALLPTLKFISETGSPGLAEHIEILDLARHHSVFQTDKGLDWPVLKSSLASANTASIDIHSLSDSHHDAQFFLTQVRRLLRASDKPGVLVILSTPVAFESGEDLTPISLESLPACRVFYIRYEGAPERSMNRYGAGEFRGRGMRVGGAGPPMRLHMVDQLAATLKPLNPKLLDVETPEEITKALTEIQKALSH